MDETVEKKKPSKKSYFAKLKSVKNIEIYIAVIIGVIILLIYFSGSGFDLFGTSNEGGAKDESAYDYCIRMESKLTEALSSVSGAGDVKVVINFESSPEQVIAYLINNNISTDGSKITESNTENPVVLQQSGIQVPLILKTVNPKVIGVLIVADGAKNAKVRVDIITSVAVLLDVSPDKITVLSGK